MLGQEHIGGCGFQPTPERHRLDPLAEKGFYRFPSAINPLPRVRRRDAVPAALVVFGMDH